MGSPINPIVANLFMEYFKVRTLSTSPNPPRIWLRYVDDTFVVHKAEHSQQFLTTLIPSITTYSLQLRSLTNKDPSP